MALQATCVALLTAWNDRDAIFASHPTAAYVTIIRSTDAGLGLLRADVGMIPPGQTALKAEVLARQVMLARDGKVELFQNTPARLDAARALRRVRAARQCSALSCQAVSVRLTAVKRPAARQPRA
ncbi:MAG: hypothetical protein ABI678_22830 [Kofleriaceae bacterium]